MAEESRRTGADKLQAQEHRNRECTLYLHRKNAGGGGADTTLRSMEGPGRRLRGRYTLLVLDVGLTRERSKTASTAPRR